MIAPPRGWCVCDPTTAASCPQCSGDAADDRERPRWRFEQPRRMSDREYEQWLTALHSQAAAEPLRRTP